MDCGVSIGIEGYDLVVFRLNERSINADVAMQMCQRVRKLSTNKIIFVCDGRVKDWEFWPGYMSEKRSKSSRMTWALAHSQRQLRRSTRNDSYCHSMDQSTTTARGAVYGGTQNVPDRVALGLFVH